MSSYRKKHYPPETERLEYQTALAELGLYESSTERMLHTSSLTSGLPYQRPVNPKEVERLILEWDDRLLDPITVSFRDGKFNIVDGQHRVVALRKMNGSDMMVLCKVYNGLTYEQEAGLCYKLDKSKTRLSLSRSTTALLESGMDAKVTAVRGILENQGFIWALNKKRGGQNEILTARAVLAAYHLLGEPAFRRLIQLLRKTWDGDPRSLLSSIISGMALFLKTYEMELDDHSFTVKLSRVDPDEIIRRGKLDYSTNNSALRFARVILEKYNTGRSGDKKLSYRFNA